MINTDEPPSGAGGLGIQKYRIVICWGDEGFWEPALWGWGLSGGVPDTS